MFWFMLPRQKQKNTNNLKSDFELSGKKGEVLEEVKEEEIRFYNRNDRQVYKWRTWEEEAILHNAKVAEQEEDAINQTISYLRRLFFRLHRENDQIYKRALAVRDYHDYMKKKEYYEKTGICEHFFEYKHGESNNSRMQDQVCKICKETKYYMGDD